MPVKRACVLYNAFSKTRLFSRGRGRLLEGGRLFQNLSPRGGANSKRGAYWKLGAYSSIYGIKEGIDVSCCHCMSFVLTVCHDKSVIALSEVNTSGRY